MDTSNRFNPYLGLTQEQLNTKLLNAALRGEQTAMKLLINAGADVNTEDDEGITVLMWAILSYVEIEYIEMLIQKGADVNAKDGKGETALMRAAIQDGSVILETLIKNGAEVNEADTQGWTALIYAINAYAAVNIQVLIENNSKINLPDNFGRTPLIHAVRNCSMVMVEILIQKGADLSLADRGNKTAIRYANDNIYNEILNRLLCAMSPIQRNTFAFEIRRIGFVHNLKHSILLYKKNIFDIFIPSMTIYPDSPFLGSANIAFPRDLVQRIFEIYQTVLLLQCDFPSWYNHRIENDLDEILKFKEQKKIPVLIFSNSKMSDKKTSAVDALTQELEKISLEEEDDDKKTNLNRKSIN